MEETKRVTGKKGFSLRDMVLCALFAAILAVSAWLTVPGEVPFTLQTFGVFAALGLLGGKRGTIAIALYLVLGAVGLPVFSGFRGGFGVLLGTTGGYIFGFLLSGLLYWALTALLGNKGWVRLLAMVLGLLLCYAAGTGSVSPGLPAKNRPNLSGCGAGQMRCPFPAAGRSQTHPSLAPLPPAGPACSLRAMCPAGPKALPRQCIMLGS